MSTQNEAARAVIETARRIAEAFDARDLETVLAAHYQGPESCMIAHGAERAVGWEAVREQLEIRISEFEHSRTTIDRPVVTLFGDLAVITYELRNQSRLHDIDFSWTGWVTDILVRRGPGWLRVHHQESDRKL